ncbi:hypothetical protein DSOUD_1535 [Desulfuromonas soudanensis]|uniref:DUF6868 domain-containing protein n=1 Tax=Desulfuromonas soudanensis TaxID=1603606 RepID=A0A0M4D244_9BACT|nr:hypothetical protein [Desulfuromonas soudanensis]ALC16314.1 hypothetical protein DSOUD_1535 [Desulfuromonas soudanensis]
MDIRTLTSFFLWCSIINGSILILWIGFCVFAPDLVYRTQRIWFPIPRETFDVLMYGFLGLFKIFFLTFNLVPYLALLIIA